MKQLGWHFLADDRRLAYKPRRLVKPGMTLRRDPARLELCQYGLHWSEKAIDALKYATGGVVCRTDASGVTIHGDDKAVSQIRKVLWMADATDTLREFFRWCALQVIHLWDAPNVVRQYLETGDENLRDTAWATAAAWAAVRDVRSVRDARATAAAWAAMWAARATGATGARNARAVVESATRAAEAAEGAVRDARAARAKQNKKLEEMLLKLGEVS